MPVHLAMRKFRDGVEEALGKGRSRIVIIGRWSARGGADGWYCIAAKNGVVRGVASPYVVWSHPVAGGCLKCWLAFG